MNADLRALPFILHYKDAWQVELESDIQLDQEAHHFGIPIKGAVKIIAKARDGNEHAGLESAICTAGEMFYIPSGCQCVVQSHEDAGPSKVLLIQFQCMRAHSNSVINAISSKLRIARTPHVRIWIKEFNSSAGGFSIERFAMLQSYLYAMFAVLLTQTRRKGSEQALLSDYMHQARQYMIEHYAETIDMDDIVRQSGVNSSRFYRDFRKHTGLSPHQFMTKTRLDAALKLLAQSNISIMEASHSVGYEDEFYFSRLFKRHMGLPPTEYMKAAQKKIANLAPALEGDFAVLGLTPLYTAEHGWRDQYDQLLLKLKRHNPELIVVAPVEEPLLHALSEIAPVEMLHYKDVPWKQRLLEIGGILGLLSVAERWLAYFDTRVENTRQLIQRKWSDKPFIIVGVSDKRYRVFGMQRNEMNDLFYGELQITPALSVEQIGFMDADSLQDIADFACEHVLFLADSEMSDEESFLLEEGWRSCNTACRNGTCIIVRIEQPLEYNPMVYEQLLEQLTRCLLKTDEL